MPLKDTPHFRRGQTVEVRSLPEILATLDGEGMLEGLPFMPEMVRHCGQRFRVHRRADKTCVEGRGLRRLQTTVFLEELRCDGAAHDDCQRGCLLFWKEAWLKSVEDDSASSGSPSQQPAPLPLERLPTRKGDRYFCQSTELLAATVPIPRWNFSHYFRDMIHGEFTLRQFLSIVGRVLINRPRRVLGLRPWRSLVGVQTKSFKGDLDLRGGDWVEVKTAAEIEATLDAQGKNGGLSFEVEMHEHCGHRYQVTMPIRRIILEDNGTMIELSHTVALAGVTCQGRCSKNCPRSNPFYWREVWLRRVEEDEASGK